MYKNSDGVWCIMCYFGCVFQDYLPHLSKSRCDKFHKLFKRVPLDEDPIDCMFVTVLMPYQQFRNSFLDVLICPKREREGKEWREKKKDRQRKRENKRVVVNWPIHSDFFLFYLLLDVKEK